MPKMGMFKRSPSGRFTADGSGDETDDGAKKPDTRREKMNALTKLKSRRTSKTKSMEDAAPAIFNKKSQQDLHMGHNPNKLQNSFNNSMNSSFNSFNSQSMRNMNVNNYNSMRNMGNFGSMRNMNNLRNMGNFHSMRDMNSFGSSSNSKLTPRSRERMQLTLPRNPYHVDRDRPSTALITRKQLEEILAAKRKEEMLAAKSKPPPSGTSSTTLWVAEANAQANGNASDKTDAEEEQLEADQLEADRLEADQLEAVESYFEEDTDEKEASDEGEDSDEYAENFFGFEQDELDTSHENSESDEPHHRQDDDDDEVSLGSIGLHPEPRITTIRFDEYDELQTCLHINDYTKTEIGRAWYRREDYDKMVDLARKTATKAVAREKELREELETMLSSSPGRNNGSAGDGQVDQDTTAGRTDDDENSGDNNNNNNSISSRSKRSQASNGSKRKKPIEYRGLEAWTPDGSSKCRMLKESAIEMVWNEQTRQWDNNAFDPDAIAEVYVPISRTAIAAARERAIADEQLVKKLIEQEEQRAEKKRHKTMYRKSKAALSRTSKTGKDIVSVTRDLVSKTSEVGSKIGKRTARAGVAAATLDPRMMKEALRVTGRKKKEFKPEKIITQSRAANERDAEEDFMYGSQSSGMHLSISNSFDTNSQNGSRDGDDMSVGTNGSRMGYVESIASFKSNGSKSSHASHSVSQHSVSQQSNGSGSYGGLSSVSFNSRTQNEQQKKKKSKLKLLGVVPIPGTKKVYDEDRREEKAKQRLQKMARRPSWEAGLSSGKY